jgi:predicted MFS family arabinose efflux permease
VVDRVGPYVGQEPLRTSAPIPVKQSLFQLASIIIAGAAANYAFATVGPLQETMRIALGLTDNQIGVLQGPALYLPPMALGIPLGFLIDRFSRARLLTIFTTLEILGSVLTAFAPTFAVLLGARALIGLMQSANAMNASALVAEFVLPSLRGRTLMILGIAQVAGMSGAFALGGKLVALYGADSHGWRWTMLWLAVPLVAALVLTFWVREPQRLHGGRRKLAWRAAFAGLWRYRAVLLSLSFGQVIVAMGYMGALVWSAPLLARNFHLPPDRIGATMGLVLLVSGLLGPLLGGVLADLCQRTGGLRRTVSFMILLALLQVPVGFYALMPTVSGVSLLLGALCTICYMKGIICTSATTVAIPEEFLGLSFGVLNAISAVFVSLSPVAVSGLAGRIGGPASMGQALTAVCVVTSLLAATTFAVGRRHFPVLSCP